MYNKKSYTKRTPNELFIYQEDFLSIQNRRIIFGLLLLKKFDLSLFYKIISFGVISSVSQSWTKKRKNKLNVSR